jgi:NADH-quinone oxidoreductase subunit H
MLVATLVKLAVVIGALMLSVVLMTWVERRVSAIIQDRLGPNRVGPFGLFQPLADGIKFLFKEDIVPGHVHKIVYVLAPAASLTAALTAYSVIPFGPSLTVMGRSVGLVLADVNVGVLLVLAATSMGVYGIVMAGWSSNNKFSLMGGLRSSAQLISYELAMGLSVIGVLAASDTLRLTEIVRRQDHFHWNIWFMPFGALIFLIASYAETNRAPFDLPEAESELVAGYHTEYSSMKFSMFMMAEYINMATSASLFVTLFLGGWQVPGLSSILSGNALAIGQVIGFLLKVSFFMFLFVWVRWTLPRFRYDQLMNLGWKVMIPLALANIFLVGCLVVSGLLDRVQG